MTTSPTAAAHDVLITGVGLHSAFGAAEPTVAALTAGRSALAPVSLACARDLPPIYGAAAAEEVDLGRLLCGSKRKLLKYASPTAQMAIAAAGDALSSAGLLDDEARKSAMGLYVAAGLIAFDVAEVSRGIEAATGDDGAIDPAKVNEGLRRCHPLMPFKMLLNMPLGLVSIAFGLRGQNAIVYPGPEQSAACFEQATRAIAAGRLHAALVGGTNHGSSLLPLATLARLGLTACDAQAALPFGDEHAGVAVGDAAAFVVLERRDAAEARGARTLGSIGGVAGRAATDGEVGAWEAEATAALWRRVSGERPARLLVSGTASRADDEAARSACAAAWPDGRVQLSSFDGQLGITGAAALPLGLALCAQMEALETVLVCARDPRGGIGALACRLGGAK